MVVEVKTYFVPWADNSEWTTVKNQVFSPNIQDTIKAYETISMWKLRFNGVPAYIESTYSLLQVMVKEYEMTKTENLMSLYQEQDLQLSYSTALIRFVNLVTSTKNFKERTLYLAAKTRNIPDWIINLRHDAAHGQDLPTLEALHVAAELSLKWLLNNYWVNDEIFKEKSIDESLSDTNLELSLENNINISNFFNKAFSVWELCCEVKKFIIIREMDKEFFLMLEEMLNLYNFYLIEGTNSAVEYLESIVQEWISRPKNVSQNFALNTTIKTFKNYFLVFLKIILQSKEETKQLFLLSLMETSFLLKKPNSTKWKAIIILIQKIKYLSPLLQNLFQLTGKGHRVASEWLLIFLPSLKQLNKEWTMFRILKKKRKKSYQSKAKLKIKKHFRLERSKLMLPLNLFKPPIITLEIMEKVLLNPNSFDLKAIFEYLELIKSSPLLKSATEAIKTLIEIQTVDKTLRVVDETSEEAESAENDKIFTVEDLEAIDAKERELIYEEAKDDGNGWVKSSIDIHIWNKTPLGLLPFQSKVDCNLPNELNWKRQTSSRKRVSIPLMNHSRDMKKRKENQLNVDFISN